MRSHYYGSLLGSTTSVPSPPPPPVLLLAIDELDCDDSDGDDDPVDFRLPRTAATMLPAIGATLSLANETARETEHMCKMQN